MLNGTATYGTRDQFVGATAVSVVTRSALAGASFRTGPRWFETSLNASRGAGNNRTPDGVVGNSSIWSGQAMATSSIRWLSLSAGRERSEARDDLLDFGNASTIRDRASVQAQPGRVSLNGTWENAIIERGRALTFEGVSFAYPAAGRMLMVSVQYTFRSR